MSPENLEFNRVSLPDLEQLRELSRSTFVKAFGAQNNPEDLQEYLAKAFSNETLKMELLRPHSQFWFASLSGEIIGYFKINFEDAQTDLREPDAMELERIYVIEEFQNRGFGQKILDAVIEMAIQRQMRYLWLGVWEKNTRAIRFYEHNKFETIGSHPFWVGKDLQTDILMKLELK